MDAVGGVLAKVREEYGAKGLRYVAVSAFNVVFGQSLLAAGQTVMEWAPTTANMIAVAVSAVPAYLLSRYWVWQKKDKNLFFREVLPFWVLTFVGFVLSTVAVDYVSGSVTEWWVAVNMTNLSAFGVIWVAKFFIMDRILFKKAPETEEQPAGA